MRRIHMLITIGRIGLAAGLLFAVAGCNENRNKQLGGGLESKDHHALYDRSSLNNENETLGVKPKWEKQQNSGPQPDNPGALRQLDMTNPHLTKTFRFAPEISSRLEQMPGIDKATVLFTENNAYVALVMDGHDVDKEAHQDMKAHSFSPKGGVGLFGTDKGANRINWTETGGLSHSTASRITGQIMALQPSVQRVYASANPNFVQRIRFYEAESGKGVDASVYMNEFNTMIQRVFPSDTNTRR
ncbi:YhcN/YlaJ family sporulation lipoprotein [Paenibacillus doosanensis]|uniref:Sporulation lipoprotein YhcN/YlaJ (Spore_YhcN_YlaJ) n=1 Tax=Paenibacillus konkukensis TaxID=2020716 RepID=A0ABY4RHF3_9BACL|nr:MULTISPECIES: YhcN/YlaJ family sporulation lipoprotein [Paenibacillus]MCS7461106.1 YhcN/YlaJ family sporulation lipoprotein [Paenibacillus doosanensis]UQZ81602.1 Sporulation lipoprotein YhcN/YlaJ (Spore_YhcN_YlaJ) [Paenibacillus konkukensis]